jgi:hypothetical protein
VAELDYAYLAEYARVDPGGSLTAVGASYTHVSLATLPTQHLIAVAGRIRATTAEPSVLLTMIMRDEAQSLSMSFETTLVPTSGARVYAGNTPQNSMKLIGEPQPGRRLKVWVFPYAADSNVRRVKSTAWKDVDDV